VPVGAPGRQHDGEESAGFTILEVTIVVSLLLVVLGAILGVLTSVTNAEVRSQALVTNQEQVRQAIVTIDRDLRSAPSLVALPDPTQYPYLVEASTQSGTYLRWRLDTSANVLYRESSTSSSGPWTTTQRLVGVSNGMLGAPVFRYYRDATNTEEDPASSQSSDIASCTIHIHVQITAAVVAGPAPFFTEADVELRNRLPGGIVGC
jgi:type II secretory pathway component PulJ